MKFDLHVHTDLSYDSKMSVSELVEAAKKKGLSGVAVANHNKFCDLPAQKGFYFIPACEFSTDVGHLLVYFLKSEINKNLVRDDFGRFFWRDVCKFAHDQGALVFLAHPYSPKKEHSEALYREIDGVEVHNSRVVHSLVRGANDKALALAKKLSKPFSAGSDAHCPDEVGTTYWECDLPKSAINEPDFEEKLRRALLSGNGRVFAGAATPIVVARCKMQAYKKMGFILPYMKNILKVVFYAFLSLFRRAPKGEYLNLKG